MSQQQKAGLQLSHTSWPCAESNSVWPRLSVKLPVLGRQQHAVLALADQQVLGDEVTAGKDVKVSRAARSSLHVSSVSSRFSQQGKLIAVRWQSDMPLQLIL